MKIVVITEADSFHGEMEVIKGLFEEGLYRLHVRKPGFTKKEMEDYLLQIPAQYRRQVVLHSHHGLAVKYRLRGVHLTENDRKNVFRRMYLKHWLPRLRKGLSVSTSMHRLKDLKAGRSYDYIFFSPVFESISKEGHKPKYGLSQIQEGLIKTKVNVYALGGVVREKMAVCREVGFKGVAFLGTVWKSADPLKEYRSVIEECQKFTPAY